MPVGIHGYIRTSTNEQLLSVSAQQQQIAGYAAMRGWEIGRWHRDLGVSGSTRLEDRRGGNAMLQQLGKGDILIAAKLDRLFRSAIDALTVRDRFAKQNIGLHILDMGGDVMYDGVAKLVFGVLSTVAEWERNRISERIIAVRSVQRKNHQYLGGKRPFGWWHDKLTGKMIIDPREQARIQEMLRLRSIGWAYGDIGKEFKMHKMTVFRIIQREQQAQQGAAQ